MKFIPQDVGQRLGIVPTQVQERIQQDNLTYRPLDHYEMQDYILEFIKRLYDELPISGEHRRPQWESGWGENLDEFRRTNDPIALIPKYYSKSNLARVNSQIVQTSDPWFDYKMLSYFVDTVIMRYMNVSDQIVEAGCGPACHLFRLNQYFGDKQYLGLDWARSSQELINTVGLPNITGRNFDYFNPDPSVKVTGSLLFTVASLEQVHDRHAAFLEYILQQKPKLVVHFEPIQEVLHDSILLEYLSIKYMQKRRYLADYLPALFKLEREGRAEVMDVRRLYCGSQFIEGHTCVVWRPL